MISPHTAAGEQKRLYPGDNGSSCTVRLPRAQWGVLSNESTAGPAFSAAGLYFHSARALFEALKFPRHPHVQEAIANQPNPKDALRHARSARTLHDPQWWQDVQLRAMRFTVHRKAQALRHIVTTVLWESGDLPIVYHDPRDDYWGTTKQGNALCGHNMLGRLWMEVRHEIKTTGTTRPAHHFGAGLWIYGWELNDPQIIIPQDSATSLPAA